MKTIKELMNTLPQVGTVKWIGLREQRREELQVVDCVEVSVENGLKGDRYNKPSGKRQVTLIQDEHLRSIAMFLGKKEAVDPRLTRRNIVVEGINLLALKDKTFQIGEVVLKTTGACHPCSRMEELLGEGGYNAMRGHGGITTQVIKGGKISIGDVVKLIKERPKNKLKVSGS